MREIGQKLNVSTVLEGSVQKSGNRLRIMAQLINATDGCHLWSERYDREIEMQDIFDVQDEITLAVVGALKLKLLGEEKSALLKHPTGNPEAHELYLKGRFHVFKMTSKKIQTGITFFERAIQLDPSYALAYVGMAHAYRLFANALDMYPSEVFPRSKAAAQKAIDIDETLAEAHAVLGYSILWYDWNWSLAEKRFLRALEIDRNSPDASWSYALLLSCTGRHSEALAQIKHSRQLDPLSGFICACEGLYLLHAGKRDQALTRLRETVELAPDAWLPHTFLASALVEQGVFSEAVDEARAAYAINPSGSQALGYAGFAQARSGDAAAAHATLQNLLHPSSPGYIPPYPIAMIYSGLNERDEALAWLERGFENRDPRMIFLKVEPKWNNLRDDPRFIKLLKRMNL